MRYNNIMPWDKGFNAEEYKKACAENRVKHAMQGQKANENGLLFEKLILAGCEHYAMSNMAHIIKVPEPFRVLKKLQAGRASVQFIKHADPDFMGTTKNGQAIVFEAKYTIKPSLDIGALTGRQWESLERFYKCRAMVRVAVGIQDKYYFVPWAVFRDTKRIYGRKSLSQDHLAPFEVVHTGWAVLFLNYKDKVAFMREYKRALERR